MPTEQLIAIADFCRNHEIEVSFVISLQQNGLIEITTIQDTPYIDIDQLQQLEKIVLWYYDLEINIQGIETITHLLSKVIRMQDEITSLKNRLRLYERKGHV